MLDSEFILLHFILRCAITRESATVTLAGLHPTVTSSMQIYLKVHNTHDTTRFWRFEQVCLLNTKLYITLKWRSALGEQYRTNPKTGHRSSVTKKTWEELTAAICCKEFAKWLCNSFYSKRPKTQMKEEEETFSYSAELNCEIPQHRLCRTLSSPELMQELVKPVFSAWWNKLINKVTSDQ